MVAVEDFSRLVSSIYEAAVTPQHWELAIRDIQGALGGTGGSLLRGDGAVWSFHDSTIPPAAMLSYSDYYHRSDYVLAAMRTADVGEVQTGPKVVVPNRDPEFYAGWSGTYSRRCAPRTGSQRWRTASSKWPERSMWSGTGSWWSRGKAWW